MRTTFGPTYIVLLLPLFAGVLGASVLLLDAAFTGLGAVR